MMHARPVNTGPVRGFTLLEITLVIGLVVILAGGIFGFIFDLIETRERLATESTRARDASRLMDLIEHAAMTTSVDTGWGPGVSGDAESLTLAAMALMLDEEGLAPTRVLRLRHDATARTIVADITSDRAGSGRGERIDLVTRVERVRFRYLVGRGWTDSFNSQTSGSLPRAIEVAVWFDRGRVDPATGEFGDENDLLGPGGVSGFDEQAARSIADEQAMFAEDEDQPLRAPDRYRIIAVPDAEAVGSAGSSSASTGFPGPGGGS